MHKIRQSGGFLGRLLGPLLKTALPLLEYGIKIIKYLEESGSLIKGISGTIKNESKE